jgi:hypothetical protein
MNSYKTELYKVSFGIDARRDITEVTLTKIGSEFYESYTNLPILAHKLCALIQEGRMSQKEASKTIAKAMIHLTN